MKNYYININAQSSGEHEMHIKNCSFFPKNYKMVQAEYPSIAKQKASKKFNWNVDCCYYCLKSCHTS